MMKLVATLVLMFFTMLGLLALAVSPLILGVPFLAVSFSIGLWTSMRMARAHVRPL